jgi:glycosyltransferase involved in cell wall biosynthesis
VVIPARDEGESIDALLDSLLRQRRRAAEIVVVDAGSRDDTADRVRRWSERVAAIRLVEAGEAYPGEARNAGIAAASFDWIALTDAGIRVDPDWLSGLWKAHEAEPEVEMVFGHYEPSVRGWVTELAVLTYIAPCEARDGRWWRGGSVASLLLRRDLWERCGRFPRYRAAEDLIFLEAAARDGCRTAAAPEAGVTWEIPDGVAATFRRFAGYSRHNLAAGRGRYWHRGVARIYVAAGVLALVGATVTPAAWGVLVAGTAARVGRSIWRRQAGSGVRAPWRPDRVLGVAAMQLLLDLATAWGALVWLRHEAWQRR